VTPHPWQKLFINFFYAYEKIFIKNVLGGGVPTLSRIQKVFKNIFLGMNVMGGGVTLSDHA
jgi:hypothetical protein